MNFKKLILLITEKKYLFILGLGLISSTLTFLFFFFSNSLFFKIEPKKEKIDIYKVAKEEAIKLGRIESDKEVPKVGPDGKVIVPSLTYYDIGGMGPNSNKSFVSNITGSNNYLSMEIAFSSYEGEKLGDFLKEYDPDFRNIIMKEIEKRKTDEFLGYDNRNKFLDAVRDSMNEFLISKEEDPIIFNAVFKTFVIKQG
ncbi:flagellar basal body-associated FliL family protein [Alphaproteobacteria bacterium]|nr:flagellar basal body-associated FliL family protein [Alphaproteobacteria bacterium]